MSPEVKKELKLIALTERLFIYLAMLDIYEDCLGKDFTYIYRSSTEAGFCLLLDLDFGYCKHISTLKELWKQKPKEKKRNDYWFEMGHLIPRIKCLKKAITLTIKKIENETTS